MERQKNSLLTALVNGLAILFFIAGCAKSKEASLPESEIPSTFAISDFEAGAGGQPNQYTLRTEAKDIQLNSIESAKAENENGQILVDSAAVPANMQFMFQNLKISGHEARTVQIILVADGKHLTAYKSVQGLEGLTSLEKQFAKLREEVVSRSEMQRLKDKSERQRYASEIKSLEQKRMTHTGVEPSASYLVPLFKYEITAHGILERSKNDRGEETTVLKVKKTDWAVATHLQIKPVRDQEAPINIDEDQKKVLSRTFSTTKLQNQLMTAADIRNNYQIATLSQGAQVVLTSLSNEGLLIKHLVKAATLSDSEKVALSAGIKRDLIQECTDDVKQRLIERNRADLAQDCVLATREKVAASYIRIDLPAADMDGNQESTAKIKATAFDLHAGLVSIEATAKAVPVSLTETQTAAQTK